MQEYIRKLISQTIALIEKNKSHGNEFNLLKISGMGSSEVFTHTPILKELLDPRGSHGQGNLFLKSFIDSFCSEFIVDEFVQIKKEQRVGDKKKSDYLNSVYRKTYLTDIKERHDIKEHEFNELTKMLSSSIGSSCNPNRLTNTFKSKINVDLSYPTVVKYIGYLKDSFLIEEAERYDIKGRKYIGSLSKYYFCDVGVRNTILNFRQQEENHIMENILYNELRMRGYNVDVGMVETKTNIDGKTIRKQYEVDFVVNEGSNRYYIQSAFAMPNIEKEQQEKTSFSLITDSFKKVIVVKEDIKPKRDDQGIVTVGLLDFLLNKDSLKL